MTDAVGHHVSGSNPRLLIITALPEEHQALQKLLPNARKMPASHETISVFFRTPLAYDDGTTQGEYDLYFVCLGNMGNIDAAAGAADALRFVKPNYVLLVGIAGGFARNGVSIGDVLIADLVIGYEKQKVRENGKDFRFDPHHIDNRLRLASHHFELETCLSKVSAERPEGQKDKPEVHRGTIATGEKVVANSTFFDEFFEDHPKAIGVEMESGGVCCAAARDPQRPGFFMVRAVSDLANEEKNSSTTDGWRPYARELAATYAIEFLKSGPVPGGLKSDKAAANSHEREPVEPHLQATCEKLLLFALKNNNALLIVRTTDSPYLQIARAEYNDSEEALYVSALKKLISDGLIDGALEEGREHTLSYKGLKTARTLLVEKFPVELSAEWVYRKEYLNAGASSKQRECDFVIYAQNHTTSTVKDYEVQVTFPKNLALNNNYEFAKRLSYLNTEKDEVFGFPTSANSPVKPILPGKSEIVGIIKLHMDKHNLPMRKEILKSTIKVELFADSISPAILHIPLADFDPFRLCDLSHDSLEFNVKYQLRKITPGR